MHRVLNFLIFIINVAIAYRLLVLWMHLKYFLDLSQDPHLWAGT